MMVLAAVILSVALPFLARAQPSCETHLDCAASGVDGRPFCHGGECASCSEAVFCADGVDGTVGCCASSLYPESDPGSCPTYGGFCLGEVPIQNPAEWGDGDCDDGERTCEQDGWWWCCDRSSRADRCGDSIGECKNNVSKKTKKTINAVLIALAVVIPLVVVIGVLCCCFGCAGCPGYKCLHPENPNGMRRRPAPPQPVAYVMPAQQPEVVAGVLQPPKQQEMAVAQQQHA